MGVIGQEKIKGIKFGKEVVTLSLFAHNMNVYGDNPNYLSCPQETLFKITCEFPKVTRFKMNMQK